MALTKVSTDGVKDDAITSGKIPANAVGASELADNAVDTNAIANNAVTAGKTSGVQTTINNNANNRVITGSDTANTLNGESNVVIDSSGNVTIGDSTYGSSLGQLRIVNNASSTPASFSLFGYGNTSTGDSFAKIEFAQQEGGTGGQATAEIKALAVGTDERGTDLTFTTRPNTSGSSPTERMRVDSSGNIGIGTTSPTYKNAVFGGSQKTLHISGTAAPQLRIQSSTSGQADLFLQAGNSGSDAIIGNAGSNGDLVFSTNNGSSQGTRLRILDDGGICFNSDTAAANALDDYEEGTYTPTDQSGAGLSLTNNTTARYTKIGRMVYVQFDITWPSTSSSATAGFSLPFSLQVSYGGGVINWTDRGYPLFIHIGSQAYVMDNNSSIGNSSQHCINSELSGKRIIGNMWYIG